MKNPSARVSPRFLWIGIALCVILLIPVTSMAQETSPAFTADLWQHIDGSTSLIPLSEALLTHLAGMPQEEAAKHVVHHTTSEAYGALQRQASDTRLIFVTPPSADAIQTATLNGVALDLVPIAREALVLLVNAENPVTGLSTAQLRDIYQGNITNWSEVGGDDLPIIPYQRSLNSGSQTLFSQILMKDLTPMEPPTELEVTTMNFLVDAVSTYDNSDGALGYSVYFYIDRMYGNDRLRMLAVDGVTPTRETIATGEYPLCAYYYAVMRADLPQDAPERALVRFILSEEGQRVVADAGYVPLAPQDVAEPPVNPATRESCGTGGTANRVGEPVLWPEAVRRDDAYNLDWDASLRFPGDPALEAMVQACIDSLPKEQWNPSLWQTGNLVNLHDYTHRYAVVFDLAARKRLSLSDVFYDGVNYIDYINRYKV